MGESKETASPRPSWITSNPGIPPAVKESVTEDEIAEALRVRQEAIGASLSREASPEQRFIDYHLTRANLAAENQQLFDNLWRQGEPGMTRSYIHWSLMLAFHLLHLGEFDAAWYALRFVGGGESDRLRAQIEHWRQADALPDAQGCGCTAPTTGTHIDELGNEMAVNLQAPLTFRHGEYFSKRLGKLANIHICGQCGFANGHADESEAHAMRLKMRDEMHRNVALAGLQGKNARAHLEALGFHGDKTELAVEGEDAETSPVPPNHPPVIEQ